MSDLINELRERGFGDVIVTLTTLPTRIVQDYDHGIRSCLMSLINQNYEGDYEIHFNVPVKYNFTGEDFIVPEWISQLSVDYPYFKIFRTEDYGPVTKLVPTLRRTEEKSFWDTIIIVCDDDLVYHPGMVSEHVMNQLNYQMTACGYDGVRAEYPQFGDVRDHYVVTVPFDMEVNHLQHYKTVSYRRNWFGEDFFTDFVGTCWNDDILVAAYMGKKGIRRLVRTYDGEPKLITYDDWSEGKDGIKGGVESFPVLRHTAHEGREGCNLYRETMSKEVDDAYARFRDLGYLK